MGDIKDWFEDPIGETLDFISDVVDFAVDLVMLPINLLGGLMTPEMPDIPQAPGHSSATYQNDKPVNVEREGVPIPLAYGLCNVAGNILRGGNAEDTFIKMQVGHCLGECSEALAYRINDLVWDEITDASKSRVFFEGTTTQLHDVAFSGTSSAYRGLAYSGVTLPKTRQVGSINNMRCTGRWKCCHEINKSGTTVWSNNPARVLYDWYIDMEGYTRDQLDYSAFIDLAAYCDGYPQVDDPSSRNAQYPYFMVGGDDTYVWNNRRIMVAADGGQACGAGGVGGSPQVGWYHKIFVPEDVSMTIMAIGGGGGSGSGGGQYVGDVQNPVGGSGGGGGGGVSIRENVNIIYNKPAGSQKGEYACTAGLAGYAGIAGGGANGGNSAFRLVDISLPTCYAWGGGAGGGADNPPASDQKRHGNDGGSGGGGGNPSGTAGDPLNSWQNDGYVAGAASGVQGGAGGGGGGAGSAGGSGGSGNPVGGDGVDWTFYFGTKWGNEGVFGEGGNGGSGIVNYSGTDALPNSGSGGDAGSGNYDEGFHGGDGSSGVVFMSYEMVPITGVAGPFIPLLDGNTVTATTTSATFEPFRIFSNKSSKIGDYANNSWASGTGQTTNQRINFDYGQPVVLTKMVLENAHHYGSNLAVQALGIQNFDVRASNDPAAFANTTVGSGGEIWETPGNGGTAAVFDDSGASYIAAFHTTTDQEEPQLFDWSNEEAYRYWSIQIKDGYGGTGLGIRHVDIEGYLPKRYTFDFAFDNKISKNDAKKLIWNSFRGGVVNNNGKLKPVWEGYKTVSYSFTMDNIVKDSFKWSRAKQPNIVRVHYVNIYAGDSKKTFVELKDEEAVRDKGEILHEENAWYINNPTVAQRRLQFLYDKFSVTQWTCKLTGFPGAQHLEPYDRVTVSHDLPGWDAKDFMVKAKQEDQFGRPTLELEEYFEDLYEGGQASFQKAIDEATPTYVNPAAPPAQVIDPAAEAVSPETTGDSGWNDDGEYVPIINITYDQPGNATQWAGANIYVSDDDDTYRFIGFDNSGGSGFAALAAQAGLQAGTTVYIKALSVSLAGVEAADDGNAATIAYFIPLPNIYNSMNDAPDSGRRFLLPKGTYTATCAWHVPDKDIEIDGSSGVTIVPASGVSLFQFTNLTKKFAFVNFDVSTDYSAGNTSTLFAINGSTPDQMTSDISFSGVKMKQGSEVSPYAVAASPDGDIGIEANNFGGSLKIENCKATNGMRAVDLTDVKDLTFKGNKLSGQLEYGFLYDGLGSGGCDISSNWITDQKGIGIHCDTTANNPNVSRNFITADDTNSGVSVGGIYFSFSNGSVANNIVNLSTETGTQLTGVSCGFATEENVSISGNIVTLSLNSGFAALETGKDIVLLESGDMIKLEGGSGYNADAIGIYSKVSNSVIEGNTVVIDNVGSGSNVGIYHDGVNTAIGVNTVDMSNAGAGDKGIHLGTNSEENNVFGNNLLNILGHLQVVDDGAGNNMAWNKGDTLALPRSTGDYSRRFMGF